MVPNLTNSLKKIQLTGIYTWSLQSVIVYQEMLTSKPPTASSSWITTADAANHVLTQAL